MWNRLSTLSIVRALIFFTLSVMLSGCGKKDVAGQIFVVTQAKENIKLALVTVGAIPQVEFDQYLNAKKIKKLEQQQLLLTEYEKAKSNLELNTNRYNWYNLLLKDSPTVGLSEKLRKHYESIKKDLVTVEIAIAKDMAVIAKYEAFDKADYLLDGLPQSKFISKSDADGKFTLILPKGKYVITANSSRGVFGSSEIYHWLVSVDTSSVNQLLMLSNDNLLETRCNECVQLGQAALVDASAIEKQKEIDFKQKVAARSQLTAEALAQQLNCNSCHDLNKKIVGPAYKAVSMKYLRQSGASEKLVGKIMNGGKGSWGEIPMPITAATQEEASKLATWILGLSK